MKQEFITPRQFIEMPLSQATRQVIYDIKQLVKNGMVINMNDWVMTDTREKICAVCAGGAACITFNGVRSHEYPGYELSDIDLDRWTSIRIAFNRIRLTKYTRAYFTWYSIISNKALDNALIELEEVHEVITGKLDKKQLFKLYRQMNEFADVLEKHKS